MNNKKRIMKAFKKLVAAIGVAVVVALTVITVITFLMAAFGLVYWGFSASASLWDLVFGELVSFRVAYLSGAFGAFAGAVVFSIVKAFKE